MADDKTLNDGQTMPRAYDAASVEAGIYQRWLAADVFAPDGAGSRADPAKPPFVIIQPPPNVTGALHLGHAQRTAVEDAFIRQARMTGRPTLYLPGKDHAGISAQYVLDRQLATEGETRQSLGRDRYLERMAAFMTVTRPFMTGQLEHVGASLDWSRERFTMDEGSALAVRTAFKRLHDDGLAYRAEALVNWCPTCRTSISDLETIATPETGTLWTIRYHFLDDEGRPDPDAWISVATTRPETILGDTAVAVHPEDDRYRALVGRRVRIPFVERDVPVVADDVVERAFGTGAVKITPAHDLDDFETGKRHRLDRITVLDEEARINEAGGPYLGLDRFEARQRIVADLEAMGDLEGSRPHEMVIGRCQRSNDVVEPRLRTQWFVKAGPLAAKAMAAVREGRVRILPTRFEKVFFHWMENIRDWNVSRQLWWGHRIPAWYCPDGHITVSDRLGGPDACAACGRPASELVQESDIFDTWFSSGLWPFSTLGWPERTDDLARYYPGSVMETGYDILFFWVARMMMLGEWLTGMAPFETVYLSGLVRDPEGAKLSKTKGNTSDPLETIQEIGADALRFALIHGIAPGADVKLGRPKLDGARNFSNKLWNAARFVIGARPEAVSADEPLQPPDPAGLGPAERWILGRCAATIEAATRSHDAYQLGDVARLVYDAVWSEYCDWYLELAKARLADLATTPEQRLATWGTLAWVLERYVRLLHPLMPFITESVWARLPHEPGDPDLLIVAAWPTPEREAGLADRSEGESVDALLELVRAIRNARAEAGIEAAAILQADVVLPEPGVRRTYAALSGPLERLARLRDVRVHERADELPDVAAEVLAVVSQAGEARLARGSGDVERERARLARELADVERQLAAADARLADTAYLTRAPAAVVDGSRRRREELAAQAATLRARVEAAGVTT